MNSSASDPDLSNGNDDREFVTVPGYDGSIQVNRLGETRHRRHCGRWSKPTKNAADARGYVQMARRVGSRREKIAVHRLMWTAFVGPIPEGKSIDHRDRNRSNNVLSNLLEATGSEQRQNQKKHRLRRDARAIYVWRLSEPDNVMLFSHSRLAEAELGANQRALRSVANGKAKRTGEFSARWAVAAEFYDGEVFRTVTISGAPVTVSNFGRYLDGKTKAFAVTAKITEGETYAKVGTKPVLMHKAVATAWPELIGGQPGPGKTIDHKNRDRENNHPSNLRWATGTEQAENRSNCAATALLTYDYRTRRTRMLTLAFSFAGRRVGRSEVRCEAHAAYAPPLDPTATATDS